jgi:hypothetical protein
MLGYSLAKQAVNSGEKNKNQESDIISKQDE